MHRNPHEVQFVERHPQRSNGALEHRGVGHVESIALGLQHHAGFVSFLASFVGEIHIGPAGEAILFVPIALAVAEQYEFVRSFGHGRCA